MVWRKPTEQDHKAVLKRIRKSAIFNCSLLGFGVIACIFGDIFATMYYIKEGYDIPLIVILQTLMIGTIVLLTFLMKDFIRRFLHVIRKQYEVADCVVISKRKQLGYRYCHHYVLLDIYGEGQEELFTEADIYYDTQVGKNELVIRYTERKPKKKRLQDDLILKIRE